jgi:periplasmic glucans biosynthesis protein
MDLDRRAFLELLAIGAASSSLFCAPALAEGGAPAPQSTPFSFDWLVEEAGRLAASDFEPHFGNIPDALGELTYDQYRKVWFKPEAAIWKDDATQFRIDLFYPGFIYKEPVRIALVENGQATEIPFSPDLFAYGEGVQPLQQTDGVAFSGFRARYPINSPDAFQEFVVFQGASYFRAVGRNQFYGLSARGLAVNTAEPSGEEFPAFRRFWIEKPSADSDTLVVYALLDSPSLTGAYRFEITPGAETVIEVEAALVLRNDVKKIGIAPLTSMFLFDPTNRSAFDDYRRAVHDSDGLQMLTGKGEWVWRPLANPSELQISGFADQRPRGFGLMQRARSYEDFEDAEAKYERRPSLWIEPIGDWGEGVVELVEIPTAREINDNIVAYWRPKGEVQSGGPWRVAYRMRWTDERLPPPEFLYTSASRSGLSFDGNRRLFAIDFCRSDPAGDIDPAGLSMDLSSSKGNVVNPVIHSVEPGGALRVSFELDAGSEELSELRLLLVKDGKPASETWLYRWTAR